MQIICNQKFFSQQKFTKNFDKISSKTAYLNLKFLRFEQSKILPFAHLNNVFKSHQTLTFLDTFGTTNTNLFSKSALYATLVFLAQIFASQHYHSPTFKTPAKQTAILRFCGY